MSVKYGTFEMPQKIVYEEDSATATFARFVAEPFERGFGHSLGNTVRRVLLSALEAPAIISLKIEGISHEYMAVDGIIEDMTHIVLNFKGALLRHIPNEESYSPQAEYRLLSTVEVTQEMLDANNGQVFVTLGDVVKFSSFEVVNPKHHLFTVTKPLKKEVALRISIGRGYVPSERHNIKDRVIGEILVDASFSPVRLVNYYVQNTRVGQDTDYDKLILEITTDGRVSPQEALSFAAQISNKHFDVFSQIDAREIVFEENETSLVDAEDQIMRKLCQRINEIELSVRSTNCLSGAQIETIAELVVKPESDMLRFRNFGKKSLNEIKAKLYEMGLSLGMDLSKYGITNENVRDVVESYIEEHGITYEAPVLDSDEDDEEDYE